MTTYEVGLLDTNVLVHASDGGSPFHGSAKALRDRGLKGEVPVCVCPQVLNEFFAVITNPKRVSGPRPQDEARNEMEKYVRARKVMKIFPRTDIVENVLELLKRYQVTRQGIFDLQLLATMVSNRVTLIYTYNQVHFSRFKEITVVTP